MHWMIMFLATSAFGQGVAEPQNPPIGGPGVQVVTITRTVDNTVYGTDDVASSGSDLIGRPVVSVDVAGVRIDRENVRSGRVLEMMDKGNQETDALARLNLSQAVLVDAHTRRIAVEKNLANVHSDGDELSLGPAPSVAGALTDDDMKQNVGADGWMNQFGGGGFYGDNSGIGRGLRQMAMIDAGLGAASVQRQAPPQPINLTVRVVGGGTSTTTPVGVPVPVPVPADPRPAEFAHMNR